MSLTLGDRIPLITKDPSSVDPQGIDWTAWLARFATTELIITSTWTVTGPDAILTATSPSIVTGSLKTQVVLSAGTLNAEYLVTNHIQTTSGWVNDGSFTVLVQNQ